MLIEAVGILISSNTAAFAFTEELVAALDRNAGGPEGSLLLQLVYAALSIPAVCQVSFKQRHHTDACPSKIPFAQCSHTACRITGSEILPVPEQCIGLQAAADGRLGLALLRIFSRQERQPPVTGSCDQPGAAWPSGEHHTPVLHTKLQQSKPYANSLSAYATHGTESGSPQASHSCNGAKGIPSMV